MLVPKTKPLPLGAVIKPYGKIAAVGLTGGERYYWLIGKHGDVVMMPADVIEKEAGNGTN
jgi:hypothetical protein